MAGAVARSRVPALLDRCCRRSTMPKAIHRSRIRSMSSSSSVVDSESGKARAVRQQLEAAAREDRLDFFTAAKILFSTPSKPRTFGLDFHLWQFFMACLPPFAVYLVAQYARYEIRRMEKERDDAEKLKLDQAIAEEVASQRANDGNKLFEPLSRSNLGTDSPSIQQDHKVVLEPKSSHGVVNLPEKDFLALKARLDAMENKVKALESIRPGTTFIIPIGSEPNDSKGLEEGKAQKPSGPIGTNADVGVADQKRPEQQPVKDSLLEEQSQKDAEVSPKSALTSWFGMRSR